MCRCVCGIYIYIYIGVCRYIYIYMLLLFKFRSILNLLFQLAYWNVSSDFGRRAECEVVNLDNTPPALRWNHLLLSEAAKCVCSTDRDSPWSLFTVSSRFFLPLEVVRGDFPEQLWLVCQMIQVRVLPWPRHCPRFALDRKWDCSASSHFIGEYTGWSLLNERTLISRFLSIQIPGNIWVSNDKHCFSFQVLCFRLSTVPQVFSRVMALVSGVLLQSSIRILRYFDSCLLIVSSRAAVCEIGTRPFNRESSLYLII